ncbi:hypothetical protein SAMN06295905_1634 [Devosia lucknowensis]|uniref:Uncharacterized protein n=1 Tax=Devosia lucknowensis TaxID=1096929 RepID=A0A1Y6F1I6_9HYPH|nr:hypothetical protein [Devosia lucknowensis]SMQ68704.1 hypothetical protein SAMN06295905_1634 [Devosia lucknowensis]
MTAIGATRRRRLSLAWIVGLGITAILIGANAHLVYVAFTSQPACVSHLKLPDGSTDHFRAAKSGC